MSEETPVVNPQSTESAGKEGRFEGGSISNPSLSLPKGGGALKGIGEKFSVNAVSGTGSFNVPIPTTPSRSDFFPKLSLSYDSGSGNGPFGLGWNLSVPSITRKTEKGLPRYADAEESDVFILSDAEDLVPVLIHDGNQWKRDSRTEVLDGRSHNVERYRPRIEGLFARIERWQDKATGELSWRSISKDNVTSFYGKAPTSRISDPLDSSHVFKWLLDESRDDKGNVIVYEYKQENQDNIERSLPQEVNRLAVGKSFTNRYLKRIKYGKKSPGPKDDYLFQVVFDYGEHDPAKPEEGEVRKWPCRLDPFSTYRAGFEIRTYRLCQRVLMFHHFSELGDAPCLVRSTDFDYAPNPVASFLNSITQSGYIRDKQSGNYQKRSLPPVEFTYSHPTIDQSIHFIDPESLENLPVGLDGGRYQWLDLDSEGLSGILSEQQDAWFYKRNLGNARFGPEERLATEPSLVDLGSGRQQIMDLAGDGEKCLVQFSEPVAGYYERNQEGQWGPFTAFISNPNFSWNDPNLKLIDLNGDGFSDVLVSEDAAFRWYPSLAKQGFGPSAIVGKPVDEEKGPALVFADSTQSVYLADMSGGGLTDIARIRNGEVCYWPNMGYGRFGPKVTMGNAPLFDHSEQFDPTRIRLADIDGSGTTDIIYLGRDSVTFWFNQAGNSWSESHPIPNFPTTDDLASVSAVDLFGNGTACLVWSSPLPEAAYRPMRYIDLMSGQKPHLLTSITNNMGKETRLQYTASTRFYLEDLAAGSPWITKLSFPVQVLERVETRDNVSDTKLVSLYKYHHGYYDPIEREFRGFGLVEQWDTESFEHFTGSGQFHVPPVHTKTWFHTGAYVDRENISQHFAHQYYDKDPQAILLPDTILPDGLTAQEEEEACRALKGRMLRQEVCADDESIQGRHPYSVSEHNYQISLVQPALNNRHAVFFASDRESIDFHYERNPKDPRISHQVTLEVDEFGNVTKAAAIGYPRRPPALNQPPHAPEQSATLITYTENVVANEPDKADWYRIGVPVETRTYELTGVPRAGDGPYEFEAMKTAAPAAAEIQYEEQPNNNSEQKRLIERVRTLYYKDDLSGALPLGEVGSHALPYQSYKMAFTPGLLTEVYGGRVNDDLLRDEGRYVKGKDLKDAKLFDAQDQDGVWWIPSVKHIFDAAKFYLRVKFVDPFIEPLKLVYATDYDDYSLLVTRTTDPLSNAVSAENNYRTMQPERITDANGNRSQVVFDALGLIVGTAVMGKADETKGDSLEGFQAELDEATVIAHIKDPLTNPLNILQKATTRMVYDLRRYARTKKTDQNGREHGEPVVVYTLAREKHEADLEPNEPITIQHRLLYSDGFGRELQTKIQAESGSVDGNLVDHRWVGTGWTIFNNKGKPVRKYEPFFTDTPAFEDAKQKGVSSTLFYDPLERVVATLHPNHTYEKVVFDPWQLTTWDVNDTVARPDPKDDLDVGAFFDRLDSAEYLPTWHAGRINGQLGPDEKDAATKAAAHANTPMVAHLDTLGRSFLTIADNGIDSQGKPQQYRTHLTLDLEGNQRVITDALGRRAMINDFDMLSQKIHWHSVDAGDRWVLNNVAAKPMRAWDGSKNDPQAHEIRTTYDELQRPTQLFVKQGNNAEVLAERTVFVDRSDSGLTVEQTQTANLRGKFYQHYDGAGVVTNEEYDFKGNLLRVSRRLAVEYRQQVDWLPLANLTDVQQIANQAAQLLDQSESFTSTTAYDALNRPVMMTTPDASVIRPNYNEANLLEQVNVNLRGAQAVTQFVANLDYNAKGQREFCEYGNGVRTEYAYDPSTFRLINLRTTRANDQALLQDLSYTYDPVGNITHIQDNADIQNTIYFRNQRVEPGAEYAYDAIYRLISATGREHLGQTNNQVNPPRQTDDDDSFRMNLPLPSDGNAMGNYTEKYEYDQVGNILKMIHAAASGSWTRLYECEQQSNRLLNTKPSGEHDLGFPYSYDAHGNMVKMPHLAEMDWDFKDQLHVVDLGGGGKAYYVYDSAGQRVRKVIERQGGLIEERIYLGGYEVFRRLDGQGKITLERETLHVMDDKRRVALVETKTIDVDALPNTLPTTLTRYQLDNHLGSACLEVDGAGAVISYEEYYPYGSTSYQAVRNNVEVSVKRYRYTSKERDEEAGLYYHGARYYAPWLGRWSSCDPAGTVDGFNLYRFARCNPIRFTDLTGTFSDDGQRKQAGTAPAGKNVQASVTRDVERWSMRMSMEGLAWSERNRGWLDLVPVVGSALRLREHAQPVFDEWVGAGPKLSMRQGIAARAQILQDTLHLVGDVVSFAVPAAAGEKAVATAGEKAISRAAADFVVPPVEKRLVAAGEFIARTLSNPVAKNEAKVIAENAVAGSVEKGAIVARNYRGGTSAGRALAEWLSRQGVNVKGQEVTARTIGEKRIMDILVDIGGQLFNIESKMGGATRTQVQVAKDIAMEHFGARLVGKRAGDLRGAFEKILTIVVNH